jgi:DNA-binding protein HU-beta
MRKVDLVSKISDATGVPKVDVLVTIEAMFKEIRDTLATGDNVYVRGFGSFIVKKRARKVGRNIQQNTTVDIPEHYVPAFKPAQTFIDQIKEEVLPVNMDKKKKKK